MLKKTIKYTDFNGAEVEEDFYFHLSKAEIVEMEMSEDGGLSEMLKKIVASEDGKQIVAQMKKIILSAYGQRTEDGKRFIKNDTLRNEFETSEAYSELFMELCTDGDKAAEFASAIVPAGLAEEAAKLSAAEEAKEKTLLAAVPDEPAAQVKPEDETTN